MSEMSSKELTEWIAFYNLEPFGDEANNIRLVKPMADLIATMSGQKIRPMDYMHNHMKHLDDEEYLESKRASVQAQTEILFDTIESKAGK